MLITEKLNSMQLSAISRIFSSAIVRDMARKGQSPHFAKLVNEASFPGIEQSTQPIKSLFEEIFSLFSKKIYKSYRQEYIYKSAIAKNILLGIHNLNTASMLNEFRVGSCKADVVILNGTATVYEIKSDLDTLNRLEKQISEYRKVFANVYVITGKNYLDAVHAIIPDDVGIMLLNDRYNISTIRKAIDSPERTISEAIFDSIQISEAKKILKLLNLQIPDLPNTKIHSALRERFINLNPSNVHKAMVEILRKTRSLSKVSNFVIEIPQSLQAATFSASLRKNEYKRLLNVLDTPICEALNWS